MPSREHGDPKAIDCRRRARRDDQASVRASSAGWRSTSLSYIRPRRGAGQGFGYNVGRGIGAVGPAATGVAAARVGLSDGAGAGGHELRALPCRPVPARDSAGST